MEKLLPARSLIQLKDSLKDPDQKKEKLVEDAKVRFPAGDPDVGLWAYINSKVIRENGVGPVTIIDLRNVLQNNVYIVVVSQHGNTRGISSYAMILSVPIVFKVGCQPEVGARSMSE
jgi:hypothetical protein